MVGGWWVAGSAGQVTGQVWRWRPGSRRAIWGGSETSEAGDAAGRAVSKRQRAVGAYDAPGWPAGAAGSAPGADPGPVPVQPPGPVDRGGGVGMGEEVRSGWGRLRRRGEEHSSARRPAGATADSNPTHPSHPLPTWALFWLTAWAVACGRLEGWKEGAQGAVSWGHGSAQGALPAVGGKRLAQPTATTATCSPVPQQCRSPG